MSRLAAAVRARVSLARVGVAVALVAGALGAIALVEKEQSGAPSDNAVRLVPATAIVYAHLSVDSDSEQWKRGVALLRRFPQLVSEQRRLLRGLTARGEALDLEREVEPWLDDEAAIALVPGRGGRARSLILLEVSDRPLARSFLQRAVGPERASRYRGRAIRSYGPLATSFLGDFLAIGRIENVRGSIDAARGAQPSLARDSAFRRSRAAIPDRDRLLYGYASRSGVQSVLKPRRDLAGRIGRLLDDPDLEGVAATLATEKEGARLHSATALMRPPAGRAARSFRPRLIDVVSEDAMAYAGALGADRIFDAITSFAGRATVPLPPELAELRSYFGGGSGRRVARGLEPLLDKEAALFVSRSAAVPVITLVVDDVNAAEADELLARLQPVLTRILRRPSAAGQVPTFQPRRIGGIDAAVLSISPGLELTYAVFGGRAVIATSPGGLLRVRGARTRVRDNPLFAPGMRGDLDRVTSVLFLDLEQLLALGEQAGLGEAPGFGALQSDLAPVKAVSAVTQVRKTEAGDTKTAEIFIEVK